MEELKRQSGVFFDDDIEESPDDQGSATDAEGHESEETADVAPLENGRVRRRVDRKFDVESEENDAVQRSGISDEDYEGRGREGTFVG